MLLLFLLEMLNETHIATMTDVEELLTPEQHLKASIFLQEAERGSTHRSLIVFLKPIVLPFHSLSWISPLLGKTKIERQAEFSMFELNLVTKWTGQGCATLKIPSFIWRWSNNRKTSGEMEYKVLFHSSHIKVYLHLPADSSLLTIWQLNIDY